MLPRTLFSDPACPLLSPTGWWCNEDEDAELPNKDLFLDGDFLWWSEGKVRDRNNIKAGADAEELSSADCWVEDSRLLRLSGLFRTNFRRFFIFRPEDLFGLLLATVSTGLFGLFESFSSEPLPPFPPFRLLFKDEFFDVSEPVFPRSVCRREDLSLRERLSFQLGPYLGTKGLYYKNEYKYSWERCQFTLMKAMIRSIIYHRTDCLTAII